jgi:hypothetical protein
MKLVDLPQPEMPSPREPHRCATPLGRRACSLEKLMRQDPDKKRKRKWKEREVVRSGRSPENLMS